MIKIIKILLKNELTIFLCFLIIFTSFFKPIFAENNILNHSETINQSENIVNITCLENYTFINGTCLNYSLFNLTQLNESFIEFNPCLNISCQEDYHCVQGKCLLNLTYNNVDSRIIDEIQVSNQVSVIVRLYENKDYNNDYVRTNVLSTVSNSEFILELTYDSSPDFAGKISLDGLEKLANNPNVKRIEFDEIVNLFLDNSVLLINANKVWNSIFDGFNITGYGQTICVVDSGINISHPDLFNKTINQTCFCRVSGSPGCCPDGTYEDNDSTDDNGHGTHVAGIIAANGYLKGVAYNVKIVSVKVSNATGSALISDIEKAIEWCTNNPIENNISIITMSLGGGLYNNNCDNIYTGYTDKINKAISKNIFVDAATGNDANFSHISLPACISNVTSVGATTKNDFIPSFSNRNMFTDLFAPGVYINSTRWDLNNCLNGCTCSGDYMVCSGTSMAAPHVAGVAALMKQANNSLTPFDIRSIMVRTGVSIYDPNSTLAFPRVDAYRSVMAGIYDNFVSDTEIVYSDNNRKVISFNVFNDLNQTSGMGWNLSLGNNITRANNSIANLEAYDDLMVFVEYNYTTSGDYVINSTFGTNWQAIPITVNKEIDIINDSVLCAGCNNRRVFTYNLTNYYGNQIVDWMVDFGDGITSSSLNNFTILENQTIFFFIEHNYSTAQEYLISAEISSTTMKEYANNMTANITQLS
jgi:subtilisin family serine protease